ncbi:hypothetical protein ULG90_07025 [Halopseudomonas pachastrellae]|nr:hypothetical protein ULG90_07025 [Halopseudomonas pachastrellae]
MQGAGAGGVSQQPIGNGRLDMPLNPAFDQARAAFGMALRGDVRR